MLSAVYLDAGPLGLVTQRSGVPLADACRQWVDELTNGGVKIYVPEIADYEVRRELIRSGKTAGLARLDAFIGADRSRFVPISSRAMSRAAVLWAEARNRGVPTADARSLDADVILAAQVLTSNISLSAVVISTINVRHIARYVPCELWSNIHP
nr:hypothetical protein Hi04_10k_c2089_00007 [uncultured bacterium]